MMIENLQTELQNEKTINSKLDNGKSTLEKLNKELKLKLNEMETNMKVRNRAIITGLESKVEKLEEQLEIEAKERIVQQKNSRRLEKRLKEMLLQLEDERRNGENSREIMEKVNARIKTLKRQLDEAEEEISSERAVKRKLLRDLEDSQEAHEAALREMSVLKNKVRRGTSASTTLNLSRMMRATGTGDDSTVSQDDENEVE